MADLLTRPADLETRSAGKVITVGGRSRFRLVLRLIVIAYLSLLVIWPVTLVARATFSRGLAPVIEALRQTTVSRALVVVSYASGEPAEPPTTMRRALDAAVETAMLHQIRRDVELARLTHPGVDVQTLAPSAPLRVRPLEFEPEGLARLVELGRADAIECLRAWGD